MKRIKLLLLLFALILGFTGTCAFSRYLPKTAELSRAEAPWPKTEHVFRQAWWGGLYPEYCLPGAMKLVETEEQGSEGRDRVEISGRETSGEETEVPVKICFKYLTFLNE